MVQKILLKPSSKELVYRTQEDGTYFDVFSYSGTNAQEKSLGSLFVIGHIKYDEQEDLSYVVSLISSLAKREYYSSHSINAQDPKKAFEGSLKKLNEVLEDFFENKNFTLNVGLLATANDQIYISRLGKFKVGLAREGEYIDVLNNLLLFEKSSDSEQQFSNIISGKLKPGDNIFAYLPNRAMTLREKKLHPLLVSEDKELFINEIESSAKSAKNFACCGVLVSMGEVKEIPITSNNPYDMMKKSVIVNNQLHGVTQARYTQAEGDETPYPIAEEENINANTPVAYEQSDHISKSAPRINSSDLTVSKRDSIFSSIASKFARLRFINSMSTRGKLVSFSAIAAIVLIPVFLFMLLVGGGGPNEIELALLAAQNDFDEAKTSIELGDLRSARSLLGNALVQVVNIDKKEHIELSSQIKKTIVTVNKQSNSKLVNFFENTKTGSDRFAKLTLFGTTPVAITQNGSIISVEESDTLLHDFDVTPASLYSTSKRIASLNTDYTFAIYNTETQNTGLFNLQKLDEMVNDTSIYEGNLYVLAGNQIYKYANATTGGEDSTLWLQAGLSEKIQSITVDGNIYALTTEGKVVILFKGEKTGEIDLLINAKPDARIRTLDGSDKLYVQIPSEKLIHVFDKETGRLQQTHNLDTGSTIDDISLDENENIWVLSNNTIWKLN